MDGMLIPFILLLIITVALILERKYHEDKVVKIYEEKYEEWKKYTTTDTQEPIKCKELVGLVFKQESNIIIETFDQQSADKIERKKYTILQKER